MTDPVSAALHSCSQLLKMHVRALHEVSCKDGLSHERQERLIEEALNEVNGLACKYDLPDLITLVFVMTSFVIDSVLTMEGFVSQNADQN